MKKQMFTDEEYEQLIVVAAGADGGASQAQIFAFVEQCEEFQFGALLLQGILKGKIKVVEFTEKGPSYAAA